MIRPFIWDWLHHHPLMRQRENNVMNEDVEKKFTPMDDDEASEGGLHLRRSELLADKIAQTNVHLGYTRRRRQQKISLSLGGV